MANPNAYRRVYYIGGRYLEARELNFQQQIDILMDEQGMGALYRTGATLNVTPSVSGSVVTLNPTNSALPMLVMIDGNFEPFTASPLNYAGSSSAGVYLNYEIHIITAGPTGQNTDPTLIDPIFGTPTAEMGELRITITISNTLPTLDPTQQLEVNTQVIQLFGISYGAGGAVSIVYLNNANAQALGTGLTAGLVSLTDNTGTPGVAVAEDDPRLSDERVPLPDSINDSKVIPIVTSGTRADTSPIVTTPNAGGITSDKIIDTGYSTVLTWALNSIRSLLNTVYNAFFNTHQGQALGLAGSPQAALTHPIPTGALGGLYAPLSHVGLAMDLSTSHQPLINSDTDGFVVVDTGADPSDYSFVTRNGSTVMGGITHGGDAYLKAADAYTVSPGGNSPDGSSMYSGTIGQASNLAHVLEQHVNQNSHANPHGLACADIGAATTVYVDSLHYPMSETLFLGYYTSGQDVSVASNPGKFQSPLTGYQYSQAQVVKYIYVMTSVRPPASGFSEGQMTNPGDVSTPPAGTNYVLFNINFWVNSSTFTTYNQVAWWGVNGATAEEIDLQGYGEVYAICQRS
jgi:hypothetical protein